jgi:hypothetical protein
MFKSIILAIFITPLMIALPFSAAQAYHHGYHGHGYGPGYGYDRPYHRGSGAYFSFSSGPGYYRPYRSYSPYYYAAPPTQVIVTQPQPVYLPSPVTNVASEDRYCREYQSSARVGGLNQPTYGTACMQPDGSWEIITQQQE